MSETPEHFLVMRNFQVLKKKKKKKGGERAKHFKSSGEDDGERTVLVLLEVNIRVRRPHWSFRVSRFVMNGWMLFLLLCY